MTLRCMRVPDDYILSLLASGAIGDDEPGPETNGP